MAKERERIPWAFPNIDIDTSHASVPRVERHTQLTHDMNPGARARNVRVLLFIRPQLLRLSIAALIEAQPGFLVVGATDNCAGCCQAKIDFDPDVLVCDLELEAKPSDEYLGTIHGGQSDLPIIVMHDKIRNDCLKSALRLGIKGFLTHDTDSENLFSAIRLVSQGKTFLDEGMQSQVMRLVGGAGFESLTDREMMILGLIAKGETNQEIADDLFMSKSTVKHYVSEVLRKLNASNRAHAVTVASAMGLL